MLSSLLLTIIRHGMTVRRAWEPVSVLSVRAILVPLYLVIAPISDIAQEVSRLLLGHATHYHRANIGIAQSLLCDLELVLFWN
jgi:hypothetical protein